MSVHFCVALLLGRVYAFAPDESGYLNIFKTVYRGDFNIDTILGWKDAQVNFIRVIYSPARLLEAVGVPDYLAVRLLSIAISGFSFYLVMCLARDMNVKSHARLLVVVAIIPSSFAWMTLGLREPFLYVSLSMICTGMYFMGKAELKRPAVFLSIGILIFLETKPDVALLIFLSLFFWFAIDILRSRKLLLRHRYFVVALVVPMVLNLQGVNFVVQTVRFQISSVFSTGATSIATYVDQNAAAALENINSTTEGLKRVINKEPNSAFVKILKITGLDSKLTSSSSSSNASGQTSSSKRLNVAPAKISKPLTLVARSSGFLFTPFPLIDNGSLFLNILSLESPLWWFLYISFGIAVWRRFASKAVDDLAIFVMSFSFMFLIFSALTEINVGTLTRHRSVFLFPFLFLILSKPNESKLA